jgi:hypothetical protein
MHPRLTELIDVLERERAGVLAAVASIPADALERRPSPDAWSAAHVIEHLRLVESGSARLLARRLARAREAGLPPETDTASVLGTLDGFGVVEGDRRVAPDVVAPPADVRAGEALEGLARSRAELLAVLHDGDGLALGQVRATHQLFGDIDLYQWALFVALHEARHARQLRELSVALASAAGTATA